MNGMCIKGIILLLSVLTLSGSIQAKQARILNIRPIVDAKSDKAKLKHFVSNEHLLSDAEKEYEVMDVPADKDKVISIIDFAYMLQQFDDLMDAKVSGPRRIRIKRNLNSEMLSRAKEAILSEIKKISPWDDWEIDVLFSSNDDTVLNRIKDFEVVEVMPYNNRSMLGNIQFRTLFRDKEGRETGNPLINPVILKKAEVTVMDSSGSKGQVLTSSDIKTIPIWIGSNKNDYITDITECIGRELANNLSTGDIIKSKDLMNPICAKKGDVVWVESRRGALTITLPVIALQTGRKGEVIKLQNKSSRKIFSAKLTGDKQAQHEVGR